MSFPYKRVMKIVYEIPDEAIELLKRFGKEGAAEFRDSEYKNVEEFKKGSLYGTENAGGKVRDEEWFFKRNFCNQDELTDLIAHNFIDCDTNCWNLTYRITDIGKKVLEKLDINNTEIQM